jgi:hypothetical protein
MIRKREAGGTALVVLAGMTLFLLPIASGTTVVPPTTNFWFVNNGTFHGGGLTVDHSLAGTATSSAMSKSTFTFKGSGFQLTLAGNRHVNVYLDMAGVTVPTSGPDKGLLCISIAVTVTGISGSASNTDLCITFHMQTGPHVLYFFLLSSTLSGKVTASDTITVTLSCSHDYLANGGNCGSLYWGGANTGHITNTHVQLPVP